MNLKQKFKNRKFNPVIMLVYGLIVGAAGYLIIVSRAAPPPPTIYLTPTPQNFAINTTFTVDVRENSGTTAVNAVQANISYPATLVDFVSIDTTTSAFTTDAQATGGSGSVNIARGIVGSLTGDQKIATITFRTKATGGTATMAFTSGTALVSATTNTDLLGSLAATAGGSYTIDATAPTVALSTPANNAVIAGGSSVTITATATDNTGVQKVDLIVDGTVKLSPTAVPYSYIWPTTGVALGAHTIQAKAYDNYGNTATTTAITVTLTDQTAPTVSITAPLNNATVNGTIPINVTANDNSGGTGVKQVDFYVDNVLKSTDATSPYTYSWDSKTVLDGAHNLVAKAIDNASPGNIGTSSTVIVNVDNADKTPPTTPGNFTSPSQTLDSISLSWTASTDNIGVTGYTLKRGTTTLNIGTGLSFTDTGLTPGTSYTYTVVAVDAAGNSSTAATLTTSTIRLKPGDVNRDGFVNLTDLSTLLTNWGTANTNCDLNANGIVDIYDLSILLTNYGT